MRLVRFVFNRKEKWGILKDKSITVLKDAPYAGIQKSRVVVPLNRVRLLAPANPVKVVLVGLNYRDHAKELEMDIPENPILFLKPPATVIAHKQKIMYPEGVKRLDYEAELALVIKKKAKNISKEKISQYILGYTCVNDITARDIQHKDIQWTRAKSFDTFCPVGPWIETKLDPSSLKIRSYVNGRLKQDSSTSNFVFKVEELVSFITHCMTLFPGDIVSTGTPFGVGPMNRGDTVEIEVEGIGTLQNKVV